MVLCTERFAIGPDKRFGAGVDWTKVKNTWTISRENMRFYWLLFTLQKHENRTESIRIQLKRLQQHNFRNRLGFSPAARKTTGAELCFDCAESQDPKFISPPGEKKIGVTLTAASLKTAYIYTWWKKQNLEGRHCVEGDTRHRHDMVLGEMDAMGIPV